MSGERFALVTGTSSGIGAAVVRQLLANGWQVMGIARRAVRIDGNYRHMSADLADAGAVAPIIERELAARLAEASWERIGLVNNAAAAPVGRVQSLKAAELARALALNVAMPLWLMGVAARLKPAEAKLRVVNISSGAAHRAVPGLAAYCASKAALRMAGMVAAAELDDDTAIYSYEPGVVDTEMQRAARDMPLDEFPSGTLFRQYHAEGRLAPPEAPAADIVEFIESERAERFAEGRRT
jgi:NAD(P)-dependent dehydrogenase (short-subunit alcohol dehydrogenase family)